MGKYGAGLALAILGACTGLPRASHAQAMGEVRVAFAKAGLIAGASPAAGRANCWARASNGNAAAALPTRPMNSRRFMSAPWLRRRHRTVSNADPDRGWMSVVGQKAKGSE